MLIKQGVGSRQQAADRQKAEGFKVRSQKSGGGASPAPQKFLLATYYLLLATFPTPLTPNPYESRYTSKLERSPSGCKAKP
jgi:hypothetical protein